MKKQIGVLLAAFLILLLGWAILPAPEMPSDDPPEEDIAGSDWRTWGIINDSGTLVQDGETIPFCACVHTGNTTLYHDTEGQVLLAELDYPAPVENAEQRYLGVPVEQQFQRSVFLRKAEQDIAAAVAVPVCGLHAETGAFRSVPA